MSPMNNDNPSSSYKFTRGEKCIFIHLVLTFVLILVSTIIYFIHVYIVDHPGNSYLNTRRSSQQRLEEIAVPDYLPIGALYLNVSHFRVTCNTIQLREMWSIAPAHCVIIRTDPSMAPWLQEWKIEYRTVDFKFVDEPSARLTCHVSDELPDVVMGEISLAFRQLAINKAPGEDGLTFELLKAGDALQFRPPQRRYTGVMERGSCCAVFTFKNISNTDCAMGMQDKNLRITKWIPHLTPNKDVQGTHFTLHSVNKLDWAQCNNYMAPVVDIRSYEYCISLPKNDIVYLNHGAALLRGNEVVGFFSWSERQRRMLPLIILHIAEFKDWIQDAVTVPDIFN